MLSISKTVLIAIGYFTVNSLNLNRNENFIYIVHFEHFDLLSISQTDLIAIGYFTVNSLNLNGNENLSLVFPKF